MGKAEREKGKRGEREIARLLKDMGFNAHRTQQYCGNTGDAADVVGIDGFHLEVKRCETTKIHEWIRQAERDCGENVPIVLHRRNGEVWYATMPAIDLFQLIMEGRGTKHEQMDSV
jgi:Holliday junction resolvase